MNDNQFATTMMVIIGTLIALTVLILVIANILLPDTNYSEDDLIQGNIQERIKPVGTLAVAGMSTANAEGGSDSGATTVASNDTEASKSAEDLYTACAACHNTGVLNAPKFGDKASWQARLAKGVDALYASALNGTPNGMPPKGGRADYSDDDIKKVVDYMLESVK